MNVLVLGGGGVFGSRLARMLARDGHTLTLAGRDEGRLRGLAAELGCKTIYLDRIADLEAIVGVAPDVVVDAAGPFQAYSAAPYRLAEFCIDHQIHYLDLSDDASFSQGISVLDEAARRAGVFAVSAASSTPAISAAAVALLATNMAEVAAIHTAILPGNKAPRGRSVIAAILHQVGGDLRLWRDGRWTKVRAWTDPRTYVLGFVRPRRAFLIGAPELALFPERFGARNVTFRAGMELGILNGAVSMYGWLRRRKLIGPSNWVVGTALTVSRLFEHFGDDRGAMVVRVIGTQSGRQVAHEWRLIAEQGEGPFVPGTPVRALLRKASRIEPGARACIDQVTLDDLAGAMSDLKVSTAVERVRPLFESILGDAWESLPDPVRNLHTIFEPQLFNGEAEIERGRNPLAQALAGLFGFPKAGRNISVRVDIEPTSAGESWTRTFGTAAFRSYLSQGGAVGVLRERFGALSFDMALKVESGALLYPVIRGRAFGIPMPKALLPISVTTEREQDGAFRFDVALYAPLGMGLMVRYRGDLAPVHPTGERAPIEILYNGVCPICRAGACDLERRAVAARAGVVFTDVAANPDALKRAGVTLDDVRLKLHAIEPGGRVAAGMPAVALAWSATPPYRALGRLARWPVISAAAAGLYHVTAHVLWQWNRACGRW